MSKNYEEKTWEEFRDSGLGWFINMTLHAFGWSLCFESDENGIRRVFPARTTWIGFSEEDNEISHEKFKKYMKDYTNEK
jgi:hypothetical protein